MQNNGYVTIKGFTVYHIYIYIYIILQVNGLTVYSNILVKQLHQYVQSQQYVVRTAARWSVGAE